MKRILMLMLIGGCVLLSGCVRHAATTPSDDNALTIVDHSYGNHMPQGTRS